ncbi:hypothetical protein [Allosphingosinicella sp.]|uniref:hypothetical protein n=1 Tax=Allosphingosinicella sp. TaxID=2823234 RepID=UPI002EFE5E03
MRKLETWLAGLLTAAALLAPLAALEPLSCLQSVAAGAAGACDDGSAHLAMGCASVLL